MPSTPAMTTGTMDFMTSSGRITPMDAMPTPDLAVPYAAPMPGTEGAERGRRVTLALSSEKQCESSNNILSDCFPCETQTRLQKCERGKKSCHCPIGGSGDLLRRWEGGARREYATTRDVHEKTRADMAPMKPKKGAT